MYYQRRVTMSSLKRWVVALPLSVTCGLSLMNYTNAQEVKPALTSLKELKHTKPMARHLNIQQWTTTAGSRVLFVEAHELPMYDVQLTFAAGSSQDGDKYGVALLTNAMLNEGVKGMNVTEIAKTFEGVGANFGNGSYRDMAIVSLRSLVDPVKSETALGLLTKILKEPSFPAQSFERIKNQLLTGFEIQQKTPGKILSKDFYSKLYGTHPYAHSSDGTPDSIKAMTLEDINAFYNKAYTAKNAVIAIVGDLSTAQAKKIAETLSDALPKGEALVSTIVPEQPKAGRYHTEFSSQQMHIVLGGLGVTRTDPDYPALYIGNQILGGGSLNSRLMVEIRERRGLTYGIYSSFLNMQAPGPFSIGLQTRAEMTEGTLALIKQLVADYLANGPTQQELDDAKQEVMGSFPLTNASNASIVGQLGAIGFYHLPLDYLDTFMQNIQSLTTEQVKAAMNKHLKVDDFVVITVGPTVKQQALPTPTAIKKTVGGASN